MKKNLMMRIAAVALVVVLATTCVISGTFAKYISNTNSNDGARVAKWGWNGASITIEDLFAETYNGGNDTSVANGTSDGKDLVAPGTTGSITIELFADDAFAPEVAYNLTFVVTQSIDDDLEEKIDWTLTINGQAQTLTNNTLAEIETIIEALSADHAPNDEVGYTIEIGWVWEFNDVDNVENAENVSDVELGDAASAEVSLAIDITAKQLDTYTAPVQNES